MQTSYLLIPTDVQDALSRLQSVTGHPELPSLDNHTFLRGWHALFWLHPELHPDDTDCWQEQGAAGYLPLATEAFRRAQAGRIDAESELYPSEAQQTGLRAAMSRRGTATDVPFGIDDPVVILRGPDGRYVGMMAGSIEWVGDRRRAIRYFLRADAVRAQILEVKRLHGVTWTWEPLGLDGEI